MNPKLQRTDADQAILQECSLTLAGSPIIPSLPLTGLSAPFSLKQLQKRLLCSIPQTRLRESQVRKVKKIKMNQRFDSGNNFEGENEGSGNENENIEIEI